MVYFVASEWERETPAHRYLAPIIRSLTKFRLAWCTIHPQEVWYTLCLLPFQTPLSAAISILGTCPLPSQPPLSAAISILGTALA